MFIVRDFYQGERIRFFARLLAQIEFFIDVFYQDMSKEQFEAFKTVSKYIANIELKD